MALWPEFLTARPVQYAQTAVVGTSSDNPYREPLVAAFEDAMAARSQLADEAFRVGGFSGRKFRMFLNNLMRVVGDPGYLEIGLFHGASFCSAVCGNQMRAVGIDNWTEYGGTSERFYEALNRLKPASADVRIIESDFRAVDYKGVGPLNVLFYDGSHSEKDQYDGVLIPQPAMDRQHILIVDDWNWDRVRKGTFDALRDAGVKIDFQIEVRTSFGGEHLPFVSGAGSDWHNGCFAAAVSKT